MMMSTFPSLSRWSIFSESHLPADQPVHGLRVSHIVHHLFDGPDLIGCLLIFKGRFKLPVELINRSKGYSLESLSRGIEGENLFDHLRDGVLRPLLRPLPTAASH